jgi:hypothetical protein
MVNMRQTYHVVTSAVGTVWKVFGADYRTDALRLAARMSIPGNSYFVETVTRSRRPIVGCKLD